MQKLSVSDSQKAEKIIWKEILRSRDSRYDHRLHGVLSVCRGLSCYQSAAVWGRSPRALEYWVRRFEEDGLNGLMEKERPGRPPRLSRTDMERIGRDLRKDPVTSGYPDRTWTGELLRAHLSKAYGIHVGLRQSQRIMRKSIRRCWGL
jgi:transposase